MGALCQAVQSDAGRKACTPRNLNLLFLVCALWASPWSFLLPGCLLIPCSLASDVNGFLLHSPSFLNVSRYALCLPMSFLASSRARAWWVMQCLHYPLQISGQCPTVSATAIVAIYSRLMYWKLPKLPAWKQENLWPVYIVVTYNSLPVRTETTRSGLNKTGIC